MLVGCRQRNIDEMDTQAAAGVDIAFVHAAPDHQPRRETKTSDRADALALCLAHRRNADLELRNTEAIELPGNIELFVNAECDPGRLLAVTQRRVIDDQGFCFGNRHTGS